MKLAHPSLARRCLTTALLLLAASCGSDPKGVASEQAAPLVQAAPKPSVLLVHGAFADALGWQKVTALLQQRGFSVTAVENPLTSLADDVATTKRAIAALAAKGPLVVVGHSYGGAVITGAAVGSPQVKALVFVNAFAPDPAQSINALLASAAPVKLGAALLPPDSAGFVFVDPAQFRAAFCADLAPADAAVAAASQKPIAGAAFAETLDAAAWQTIPSWYLVGKQDEAINPDLERTMAKHIGAHTIEIDSSHVSFISHPLAVVRLIEEAARGAH
ncbi:MAG: alpha/beta hydrolase [Myxococcales bacterium]|nr:alpha/beta hydrolase [Myxococcales bacterium]